MQKTPTKELKVLLLLTVFPEFSEEKKHVAVVVLI